MVATDTGAAIPPGPGGEGSPPAWSGQERLAQLLPSSVLRLETLAGEVRTITVNDVDYPLRFYDQLTFVQHQRLTRLQEKAADFEALVDGESFDDLTAEEDEAISAALDELYRGMVRICVPSLPMEEVEAFSYVQLTQVVSAFLDSQTTRTARARATAEARRRAGSPSSPPSPPASATTAGGRKPRRSRKSATPTADSPA